MARLGIPSERCLQSKRLASQLNPLIPQHAPALPRTALVSASISLGFEHHHAVAHLVESGYPAAAGALVRPLLEAVVVAIWGLYVADHTLIEKLFLKNHPLPKLQAMLSAIEKRPELKGQLGLKDMMDGHGKFFHALTHGEMSQLRRRYSPTGLAYSEKENELILGLADLLALLGATVLVRATHQSVDQDIGPKADALIEELRTATGDALPKWEGWKPLPDPTIFPGRIPQQLPKNDLGSPKRA